MVFGHVKIAGGIKGQTLQFSGIAQTGINRLVQVGVISG
jgi:hypothetical protein